MASLSTSLLNPVQAALLQIKIKEKLLSDQENLAIIPPSSDIFKKSQRCD